MSKRIVKLPKWNELPTVNLYLEQVIQLVNQTMAPYMNREENLNERINIITRTMVNNYVKQGFIKAPLNKKYDRISVASLLVIAVLKSIFTMEEISRLISLAVDSNDPETSYDNFCDKLEEATKCVFKGYSLKPMEDQKDPRNICYAACWAFASQYYVRKIFLNE